MNNEIEVGSFVRLKQGYIGTVENINDFREPSMKYAVDIQKRDLVFVGDDDIVTHSKIKSEIVEVGDYVNGYYVRKIANYNNELCVFDLNTMQWIPITEIDVFYSIVTHEQFSQMEYKVETEDK